MWEDHCQIVACPEESNEDSRKTGRGKKTYEGQLEALIVFSLQKLRLQEDLISVFKYIKSCQVQRTELHRIVPKDFCLTSGKKLLSQCTVE